MAKKFNAKINRIIENVAAKMPTVSTGFIDRDLWVDSGNYAMNRRWSGHFDKAYLFGRNYAFYGESGCHPAQTKIRKADGSVINVEDVLVGDKLMGIYGKPVVVQHLIRNKGKIYTVYPDDDRFAPFRVNGDHVLTLVLDSEDDPRLGYFETTVENYLSITKDHRNEGSAFCLFKTPVYERVADGKDFEEISKEEFEAFVDSKEVSNDERFSVENFMRLPLETRRERVFTLLEIDEKHIELVVHVENESNRKTLKRILELAWLSVTSEPILFGETRLCVTILDPKVTKLIKSSFRIEDEGESLDYYGFTLNEDPHYLLEDFTVTHNSGKSLMAAVAAGNAQKQHDAFVVWIDVEHATDGEVGREWFERAGVDVSEEKFLYISASTLEEIKTIIAKITVDYRKEGDSEEIPPLVFIVDSWAAAATESEWERIGGKEAGKIVGDMGQKAKQLGDVIKAVTHLCARIPVMVIGILHIMDNQDMYGRKHKTTGGHKVLYYASGAMLLTKKELQLRDVEDEELVKEYEELGDNMLADIRKKMGGDRYTLGIVSQMEVIKSRVSKPFERVDISIPYDKGVDPYSGLFELMMQEGTIRKGSPGWFEYDTPEGEVVKFRRKDFLSHADYLMGISKSILTTEDTEELEEGMEDGQQGGN